MLVEIWGELVLNPHSDPNCLVTDEKYKAEYFSFHTVNHIFVSVGKVFVQQILFSFSLALVMLEI